MTNQSKPELNRRAVLAGIGGLGVAGIGYGQLRTANRRQVYTNHTYAQPDSFDVGNNGRAAIEIDDTEGPRIQVSWYSTYNGRLLTGLPLSTTNDTDEWAYDEEGGYVSDVDGPMIQVANVLPGDYGTASIGLLAENTDARVWLRISPSCDESDGGDCEPLSENPLANVIETDLWYDTGIFGLFGCQGAEGSSFGEPIAEGVLAEMPSADGVDGSVSDGIELNPGILDNSVLEEGDRLCLALAWAFPTDVANVNELQGAGVAFDVEFRAVTADNPDNPFAVESEVTS